MARANRLVTPFVPGNKLAAGSRGLNSRQLCFRALLAEMNEVDELRGPGDPMRNKPRIEIMMKELAKLAIGYSYKTEKIVDGEVITITEHVPADLQAMIVVMDRLDGKPKQEVETKVDTRADIVYRTADDVMNDLRDRGIPVDKILDIVQNAKRDDDTVIDGEVLEVK